MAESIDRPLVKANKLFRIALAYGYLGDDDRAQALLRQTLTVAEASDDPGFKG
ncbi:MAG: hypothetical protein AAF773_11085 [Cyanobacteria bacterium P01_D01_bin.115]